MYYSINRPTLDILIRNVINSTENTPVASKIILYFMVVMPANRLRINQYDFKGTSLDPNSTK